MVCGAFSYDHMMQLKVVNGTLNSQKYRDETLESDVRLSLNSLECQNMVLQDDNARPQRARIIKEYNKNLQNIAMFPWSSLTLDLKPIKLLWDELGELFETWNQPYQTFLNFAMLPWRSGAGCQVLIACNYFFFIVTSMVKRCKVVIRQREVIHNFNWLLRVVW